MHLAQNRIRETEMIVNYDRNPDLTIDEKLQSLVECIQLALNEKADNAKIEELKKEISKMNDQ